MAAFARTTVLLLLLASTAVAAHAQPACVGDCDGDGGVQINELVLAVRVLLGDELLSACPAIDCSEDFGPPINCAVLAVASALEGCAAAPVPTETPTCVPRATRIPDSPCHLQQACIGPCVRSGVRGTCRRSASVPACDCELEGPVPTPENVCPEPTGKPTNTPDSSLHLSCPITPGETVVIDGTPFVVFARACTPTPTPK
jgi:hypothetical protein